jgi:sporulation protein YlmC with PRC-barrel domain
MSTLKLMRVLVASTALAATPVVFAVAGHAQSQAPATTQDVSPSGSATPPTRPDAGGAATSPSTAPSRMTAPSASPDKSATQTDPARQPLMGLAVYGSDGQKVGDVQGVKAGADGKVSEIHVRTGGFLGFGGKIVAIPATQFSQSGTNIQLNMSAEDASKLPKMGDQKG